MLKRFLFVFLCLFFSAAYCVEVDKEQFINKTHKEIIQTDGYKDDLRCSLDAYTWYYLQGKVAGILEARRIFEECEVRSQSLLLSTQ